MYILVAIFCTSKITENCTFAISGYSSFEVIDGNRYYKSNQTYLMEDIGKQISINGQKVSDHELTDENGFVYIIAHGKITNFFFKVKYKLDQGGSLIIQQNVSYKISKGDKVIDAKPIYPLPDGSYKIQGKLFKKKIIKNTVI